MAGTFLFDLDMTLVESSALAQLRTYQLWSQVKANMNLIRPFPPQGQLVPHDLPAKLKGAGHRVGIVTSSPRWYADQVLNQFRIPFDALVAYDDTQSHKPDPEPLVEVLKRLGVAPSPSVFYIGDDVGDFEASYHAGLTSIGVKWGPASVFELASTAPDIFIDQPSTLLETDRLPGRNYMGEALTAGLPFFAHWGSILHCDQTPAVNSLGRYFTAGDPRHATAALSAAVLSLKDNDTRAPVLGRALGTAIASLDWTPDYVVPVPMKPSQERNRFAQVLEHAQATIGRSIGLIIDGLRCVKEVPDYKTKPALEREEAIRDAFVSNYTWKQGKVLLIDDVYTTGSTTNECIRMLKANDAAEVRVLCLAKDQRTFVRKTCPSCGRSMKIRTNSTTGARFWGCSGYPDHCRNTENL